MATALVTWTETDKTFPAGTVAVGYKVFVRSTADAGKVQSVDIPLAHPHKATFTLDVGEWEAIVSLVDSMGQALGAASTKFLIESPGEVTIPIPDTVMVITNA